MTLSGFDRGLICAADQSWSMKVVARREIGFFAYPSGVALAARTEITTICCDMQSAEVWKSICWGFWGILSERCRVVVVGKGTIPGVEQGQGRRD